MSGMLSFIVFLFCLSLVIFFHELGHFLVARWVGIKCEQFAVGFGQALISFRRGLGFRMGSSEAEYRKALESGVDPKTLGETEYRLNWIPLGGYVKMLGQDDMDPTKVSNDPRSFNNKSVGARAAVISAGVIVNLIMAIPLFIAAFTMGIETPPAQIGEVAPFSPAEEAVAIEDSSLVGLKPGDHVVSINGKPTKDDGFMGIALGTALSSKGDPINYEVDRPNPDGVSPPRRLNFVIKPRAVDTGILQAGVMPAHSLQMGDDFGLDEEGKKLRDERLAYYGLNKNHQLVAVDDRPIAHHWQLLQALENSKGKALKLTFNEGVDKQASPVHVTINPETDLGIKKVANPAPDQAPYNQSLLGLHPALVVGPIEPDQPAAKAGLKAGDIIVRVGDSLRWPTDMSAAVAAIQASKGNPIAFEVIRDGKTHEFQVTPVLRGNWLTKIFKRDYRVGIPMSAAIEQNIVAAIDTDSPFAALTALKPGGRITHFDGKPINNFSDLRLAIEGAQNKLTVPVTIQSADQSKTETKETATATPATSPTSVEELEKLKTDPNASPELKDALTQLDVAQKEMQDALKAKESEAAQSKPAPATTAAAPATEPKPADAKPVTATAETKPAQPEGAKVDVTVQLPPIEPDKTSAGQITLTAAQIQEVAKLGWTFPAAPRSGVSLLNEFDPLNEKQIAGNPIQAIQMGLNRTKMMVQQVYLTLLRVGQGSVPVAQLQGPVGITRAGMLFLDRGFPYLLWFMGMICVNLAIVNFLPLPVVDGGLMTMLLIEKARGGKPLPLRVQAAVAYAGYALILGFFLFVTFHDLKRWLFGSM